MSFSTTLHLFYFLLNPELTVLISPTSQFYLQHPGIRSRKPCLLSFDMSSGVPNSNSWAFTGKHFSHSATSLPLNPYEKEFNFKRKSITYRLDVQSISLQCWRLFSNFFLQSLKRNITNNQISDLKLLSAADSHSSF